MTERQMGPLGKRERDILDVLVTMHGELGLDKDFTAGAVAVAANSPCPGSLAGLTLKGYVLQRSTREGISYRVSEAGYQLFAGVEGLMD